MEVEVEVVDVKVVEEENPQNEQNSLQNKVPTLELPDNIKQEILNNRGNPENVLSYSYDKEGRLVWLESGNMYMTTSGEKGSGFWHIENRHFEQFQSKFDNNLTESQMVEMIEDAVRNGRCVIENNSRGEVKVYLYESSFNGNHLTVYVGNNGFIIGARPGKIK